jgi:nucleoside-diphosphate-sugar epimerase
MMPSFAIFGASGQTGPYIGRALSCSGLAYRAVGRNRPALEAAFAADPFAEIVTWDPQSSASVEEAANGIDTIFYTVGVPYDQFELHPVIMRRTLEGALAARVRRIVLITNVYPYGIPQTNPVEENHPRNPQTFKGRMRKEQEDVLFEAHASGNIAATALRLPDFFGPGVRGSLVYDLFVAAKKGGRANLIGPIDLPHQFVYVPDIGPVAVALAAQEQAYGSVFHFAGSGTMTQRELAQRVFAQAGTKPKYMVANKTMLRLFGLAVPLMRELVEMHYLETTPVILDDRKLRALLPQTTATTYDEAITQTLAAS